jgi:hypothetical protein
MFDDAGQKCLLRLSSLCSDLIQYFLTLVVIVVLKEIFRGTPTLSPTDHHDSNKTRYLLARHKDSASALRRHNASVLLVTRYDPPVIINRIDDIIVCLVD